MDYIFGGLCLMDTRVYDECDCVVSVVVVMIILQAGIKGTVGN